MYNVYYFLFKWVAEIQPVNPALLLPFPHNPLLHYKPNVAMKCCIKDWVYGLGRWGVCCHLLKSDHITLVILSFCEKSYYVVVLNIIDELHDNETHCKWNWIELILSFRMVWLVHMTNRTNWISLPSFILLHVEILLNGK